MTRSLLFTVLLALAACSARPPAPGPAAARAALMAADRAFAAETATRGLDGWMDAYTSDAVRLHMGGSAAEGTVVHGHDAIRTFDANLFSDPGLQLTWEPTEAGVFADGRYGFTTGRSLLVRPATADTLHRGTYVTLWRRGADGRWRVVLDTGAGD
ncbi:MAG TPA: nuclear transport factor 2 family protein [Rubricoccaceae bacterium]|nr:nuclear transport factor 2 family protein [Rubricoccaceae bacterium]